MKIPRKWQFEIYFLVGWEIWIPWWQGASLDIGVQMLISYSSSGAACETASRRHLCCWHIRPNLGQESSLLPSSWMWPCKLKTSHLHLCWKILRNENTRAWCPGVLSKALIPRKAGKSQNLRERSSKGEVPKQCEDEVLTPRALAWVSSLSSKHWDWATEPHTLTPGGHWSNMRGSCQHTLHPPHLSCFSSSTLHPPSGTACSALLLVWAWRWSRLWDVSHLDRCHGKSLRTITSRHFFSVPLLHGN